MTVKSLKRFLNLKSGKADNIVFCIVVLALGYIIIKSLIDAVTVPHVHEGFEGRKELLLLHMEGCPHCVKLMPHWDAASKENKTEISMRSVERREGDGPELCKKHNVTGFPTILLLGGGKKLKTYTGPRNKSGLINFMTQNA